MHRSPRGGLESSAGKPLRPRGRWGRDRATARCTDSRHRTWRGSDCGAACLPNSRAPGRAALQRVRRRSLRGCRWRFWLPDDDGLDVDEFLDAVHAELTAIAAALDAAERDSRIGRDHAIDEDAAGFDVASQLLALLDVARPERGAEAV